jgi:crotonobetainyl-CoA:carnitine CoA-transferase CaiB-like acyl-CoA transferase
VVSDLRPAEARALGLTLARLRAWAPVVVSATTYGLDGPDADRPGPLPAPASFGPVVDAALAGAHAAVAALAALRWVRHAGRGVVVEVATIEVVAACLGDRVPCPRAGVETTAEHPSAGSAGRLAATPAVRPAAPPGRTRPAPGADALATSTGHLLVLPCADGYVGVAASATADAASRAELAALTGLPALADPAAPLAAALAPWLRARTRAAVFHAAQLWRLPIVPALEPAEVPVDAQSVARGCWQAQDGRLEPRSPFRYTWTTACRDRGKPGPTRVHPPPDAGSKAGRRLPLADLRVLDLGMVWAGPYCGRLLAGLGATVMKVEGPRRVDGTRAGGRGDCTGAFGDLNRGKASLVVDLASRAGRELFLRLAGTADVVLENFSPRVMPNLGLDYATLARTNPRLLMLSLPAFGASGPWRDYVAYGSGLELATGLAPRAADGCPVPAPVAYLDYLAGTYGALGLLAALLARDRAGRGTHLELAQREVAAQVLGAVREKDSEQTSAALDPAALGAGRHLTARGLFAAPTPTGSTCHHYARLPWRLHGVPSRRERSAPAYGADTRRLLRRVGGLTAAAIATLARAGIVASTEY